MKTTLETITPTMAEKYLEKNHQGNRHLRVTHVGNLAAAMSRGEWIPNHQGISFDVLGNLNDGQHRLRAIIQYGHPIQMNVTRDVPVDSFKTVDIGIKRSVADVLGGSVRKNAIGAFLSRILYGNFGATPTGIEQVIKFFEPEIEMLIAHCGSTKKTFSSSAVQAAAVFRLRMDSSAADYILNTYRSMVLGHLNELPSVAVSFVNQVNNRTISSSRGEDLFVRAFITFDYRKSGISVVAYKDKAPTMSLVRNRFCTAIGVV